MFNPFKKHDPQIQQDVMNELKWDPRVIATQISATVEEGIVTLRGSVPHYFEKTSAEQAARRVGGVRWVNDEIEVVPLEPHQKSDEAIAHAARNALEWNYVVPEEVTAEVNNGWITLKGTVNWDYQRRAAREAVCSLMGVYGVSNEIKIKSSVAQPSDVKNRIEEALKRSAESEAREIKVVVDGGQVTLSGNVHSYSEIEDARLAAWNAPGVLSVENNLKLAA